MGGIRAMKDTNGPDKERILKGKYEVWQYRDDGSKYLDDIETVDAVPIEELEELADDFNRMASYYAESQVNALIDEYGKNNE